MWSSLNRNSGQLWTRLSMTWRIMQIEQGVIHVVLFSFRSLASETHNLQPVFLRIYDTKGGHGARRSLRRPCKLGLRIVAWPKPRMHCEESLGKIKFRAFSETCRSTNSIAWKRWLLWNKWTLLSGRKKNKNLT